MNGDPAPLAVGLVDVRGLRPLEEVDARVRVMDAARVEGYSLLEVLAVGGDRRRDVDVYAAAVALARREGAVAFLVHGDVDTRRLRQATVDAPMRVVRLAPPGARVPAQVRPGRPTSQGVEGTLHTAPAASAQRPHGRLVTPGGVR